MIIFVYLGMGNQKTEWGWVDIERFKLKNPNIEIRIAIPNNRNIVADYDPSQMIIKTYPLNLLDFVP